MQVARGIIALDPQDPGAIDQRAQCDMRTRELTALRRLS